MRKITLFIAVLTLAISVQAQPHSLLLKKPADSLLLMRPADSMLLMKTSDSTLLTKTSDSIFIKKISDEILTNGKAYEYLHQLTKQVGPRLAGSPGMVKAEAWGQLTLRSIGADKIWLQECMVPHWVRGGTDVLLATSPKKKLDAIALGNSQGSGNKAIIAPVIEVKSFEDLELKKDLVKGKIVFYNYHFNPTFVNTLQSYADAVRYRGGGPSAAAKYGAVAVVVRNMSHGTDNIPHTGATNYDSIHAKIPAVALGLRDADWLDSALTKGSVTISMKTNGHFLPDTMGHNVIGELLGSEFPERIITIGGHLDCWDNTEGAQDDGAGIVQTLEVLRTMKALNYHPKHTIRFVLFANEENGGRGGDKYIEEAIAKKEKHVFALESDDGGFTPRGFTITSSDSVYAKVLSWKDLIGPYGSMDFPRGGGGGADVEALNYQLGVPVVGLEPDSQRYFDFHHARTDVFENVNRRELLLGAVNMSVLIYLVDQHGL